MPVEERHLDTDRGVALAATLDRLRDEPQELKTSTIIGIYQSVKEDQVEEADVRAQRVLPGACPSMLPSVPLMCFPF